MENFDSLFVGCVQQYFKERAPFNYNQIAVLMGWSQDPALPPPTPTPPTYTPSPLFPVYPFLQSELTEEEKWKQCLASVASASLNSQGVTESVS